MPHLGTISSHFDLALGRGQRKIEQTGAPVCSATVPTAALTFGSSPSLLAKQPGLSWYGSVVFVLPFSHLGYKGKPESVLGTTILEHCGVIRPGLKLMPTWFEQGWGTISVARDAGREGKGAGQQIQRSKHENANIWLQTSWMWLVLGRLVSKCRKTLVLACGSSSFMS